MSCLDNFEHQLLYLHVLPTHFSLYLHVLPTHLWAQAAVDLSMMDGFEHCYILGVISDCCTCMYCLQLRSSSKASGADCPLKQQ